MEVYSVAPVKQDHLQDPDMSESDGLQAFQDFSGCKMTTCNTS
jgi:hypothetical protein